MQCDVGYCVYFNVCTMIDSFNSSDASKLYVSVSYRYIHTAYGTVCMFRYVYVCIRNSLLAFRGGHVQIQVLYDSVSVDKPLTVCV